MLSSNVHLKPKSSGFTCEQNVTYISAFPARATCFPLYELQSKSHHQAKGTNYGVSFPLGQGIFIFSTASRPVLWPTQLPIQWVPRALSPYLKRPEREVTTHLHLVTRLRMCRAIPPLHINLLGVVLS